jgi:hypothetical protein
MTPCKRRADTQCPVGKVEAAGARMLAEMRQAIEEMRALINAGPTYHGC